MMLTLFFFVDSQFPSFGGVSDRRGGELIIYINYQT